MPGVARVFCDTPETILGEVVASYEWTDAAPFMAHTAR
jgi:hypothetical protein